MSTPKLFTPAKVGDITTEHRVVLAPLTRFRADAQHVPTDLVVEHYAEAIHNVQRQKNMSTSDLAKMVRIDEWTMEDMYVARGFYLYQD